MSQVDSSELSYVPVPGKQLIVKKGDITQEQTEAIVNPANSTLIHGGGAAKAIAVKGGAEIVRQSNDIIRRRGRLSVSEAVITGAGNLPSRYVIHVVGPQMGEGNEVEKLREAIWNVLALAESEHLVSLSMPAVSSGIFGFPKPECAKILIETALQYLTQSQGSLQRVVMCNHDQETYHLFSETLQKGRRQPR